MKNAKGLTGTYLRAYKTFKKDPNGKIIAGTGLTMYVYSVDGSDEDLATFEKAQGQYHKIDKETGLPIFQSPDYCGTVAPILVNADESKAYLDGTRLAMKFNLLKQMGMAGNTQAVNSMLEEMLPPLPTADVATPEDVNVADPDGLGTA